MTSAKERQQLTEKGGGCPNGEEREKHKEQRKPPTKPNHHRVTGFVFRTLAKPPDTSNELSRESRGTAHEVRTRSTGR